MAGSSVAAHQRWRVIGAWQLKNGDSKAKRSHQQRADDISNDDAWPRQRNNMINNDLHQQARASIKRSAVALYSHGVWRYQRGDDDIKIIAGAL